MAMRAPVLLKSSKPSQAAAPSQLGSAIADAPTLKQVLHDHKVDPGRVQTPKTTCQSVGPEAQSSVLSCWGAASASRPLRESKPSSAKPNARRTRPIRKCWKRQRSDGVHLKKSLFTQRSSEHAHHIKMFRSCQPRVLSSVFIG